MDAEHQLGREMRLHGAAAIERTVRSMATYLGFTVDKLIWPVSPEIDQSDPYCLEIYIHRQSTRIYFTGAELAAYDQYHASTAVDKRIGGVVSLFDEHECAPWKTFHEAIRASLYRLVERPK